MLSFSIYVAGVPALVFLMGFNSSPIPGWLETTCVVTIAPLIIMSITLMPFLVDIGLTEGELVRLPSPLGYLVVGLFYACLLFLSLKWVARYWR